jgi:dihydrofolate reductase
MGRKMFGGGPGPWQEDPEWRGWWGDNPPYHVPVFVLTHHPREPLEMEGGTTFRFVTEGIEAAVAQARAEAGDKDVQVHGGASAVNQAVRAGLLDQLEVNIAPVILGGGERLLEDIGEVKLELVRAVDAPGATHIKYLLTY